MAMNYLKRKRKVVFLLRKFINKFLVEYCSSFAMTDSLVKREEKILPILVIIIIFYQAFLPRD